jgi:ribosomal protein S18 acetylase RimI-like enzyme
VALLDDDGVAGFIIYQMHPEWILVYDLAVWPGNRREGIGTKLVQAMKHKLGTRLEIRVFVRERNLKAQLFYKACGFRAIETRPNPNSDGEMYLMVFFKNGEPVNAWESVPDDKEEWCDGA